MYVNILNRKKTHTCSRGLLGDWPVRISYIARWNGIVRPPWQSLSNISSHLAILIRCNSIGQPGSLAINISDDTTCPVFFFVCSFVLFVCLFFLNEWINEWINGQQQTNKKIWFVCSMQCFERNRAIHNKCIKNMEKKLIKKKFNMKYNDCYVCVCVCVLRFVIIKLIWQKKNKYFITTNNNSNSNNKIRIGNQSIDQWWWRCHFHSSLPTSFI